MGDSASAEAKPPLGLVFVADIHLSADAPSRNARFFTFLNDLVGDGARALFILGDLFDVWLGDDDNTPLATQTKTALAALMQAGVPVFIQRGNRDFLLGMRFVQAARCTLLPDEYVLEIDGQRWLLAHGDSLVGDAAYLRFRRWGRPLLRLAALCLPLARRHRFAAALRSTSDGGVRQAQLDDERVGAALRRHRCINLIHGHTHKAESDDLADTGNGGGRRYGLPDWQSGGGYAAFADKQMSVISLD